MLIDILINNTDRNNGNWGVLYENDAYRLAPVFDNGASFANKCTEKRLELMLSDETRIQSSIQNTATTYGLKGKPLLARDLETLKYPGLLLAEKKNDSCNSTKKCRKSTILSRIFQKHIMDT